MKKSIVVISIIFSKSDNLYTIRDVLVYSSDVSLIKILKQYNAIKINLYEDKYYLDPIYLIPLILHQLEYRRADIIIMSKLE
jgi:hypothetical protein